MTSVKVEIEYPTPRLAQIACNSLSVDKEIKESVLTRELSVSGSILRAFDSKDLKTLRTAMTSFFDMLGVANEAINFFDI